MAAVWRHAKHATDSARGLSGISWAVSASCSDRILNWGFQNSSKKAPLGFRGQQMKGEKPSLGSMTGTAAYRCPGRFPFKHLHLPLPSCLPTPTVHISSDILHLLSTLVAVFPFNLFLIDGQYQM
jgi:hypothetical protein